jgi:peptide/nickel transport system permease protein
MRLAPGTTIDFFIGRYGDVSVETLDLLIKRWGLDQPIWIQYIKWLTALLQGDLGYSFLANISVSKLLIPKIFNTLRLMIGGIIFSVLLAIPIGVISALHQYSKRDHVIRVVSLFGLSMPSFWEGLLLIMFFAVFLGILPAGGMRSASPPTTLIGSVLDGLSHMVLPVIMLGTSGAAYLSRLVRSSMLDVLQEEYIMTARAKGLKEYIVIYKHALRNALLPVVTAIGLRFAVMMGGAAITETVFSWPGLGRTIVQSTYTRDYPVVLGVTVLISVMVMSINLVTDIVYSFIDPRVRY